MATVALCPTSGPLLRLDEVYESLEAGFVVELAVASVPSRIVGVEVDIRFEAIVGVRRPLGSVAFQEDGIDFGAVTLVATDVRRVATRGVMSRVTARSKNRAHAGG